MVPRASSELNPEIVQAGAGTGKTAWLVDKVFRISADFEKTYGRKPRLAVCTFTRKAAHELKERLASKAIEKKEQAFLEYIYSPKMFISTLHGLFYSFLKSYGWKTEINPDFHIISDSKEMQIINTLASSFLFNKYLPLLKQVPFYHLTDILKFYVRERLKHGNIAFYNAEDFKGFLKEFQFFQENPSSSSLPKTFFKDRKVAETHHFLPVFQEFQKMAEEFFPLFLERKKREGKLTTDDLELFLLDFINKNNSALRVISQDKDHWLIDEYQDTSRIQEQIIKKITQFKNVSCVGDPGQSIYLFRNADPEVFSRCIQIYGKEPERLTFNYRSETALIYFFNDFFSSKPGLFLKFKPPAASSKESNSLLKSPCAYFLPYSQRDSSEDVFKKVLSHIHRLTSMGNHYEEIAVLSTKNEDLTALSLFLEKRHIPVLLHTAEGFARKRILLDCFFLYKFLINPHDTENLTALFRTPYFKIPDEKLSLITNSFFQREKPDSSRKQETKFGELKDSHFKNQTNAPSQDKVNSLWEYCLKNLQQEKIFKTLKNCLKLKEEIGFLPAFEKITLQKILSAGNPPPNLTNASEANFWKLLNHLYKRRSSQHHPLDFYYSFMERDLNNEEASEAPASTASSSIQLLTIHGSKGLEFKNVIIFNLSKAIAFSKKEAVYDLKRNKMAFSAPYGGRNQPKIKCYGHKKINTELNEKELEETDRQLYVAMTRAKHSLCLLVPEGKVLKNSWFERFTFFEHFLNKIGDGSWKIKEGLYKKENYSFLVTGSTKEENIFSSVLPSFSKNSVRKPQLESQKAENLFKSSKDFIQFSETEKKTENNKKKVASSFHPIKSLHSFIKAQQGTQLHYYLHLLNKQSDKKVFEKIENSFLSLKEQLELKKALTYVMNLKQPCFSFFLKKGFSEWPFKLKKGAFVLQGQIDLWGWENKQAYLFDYKSSVNSQPLIKKQLAFYAYVLDQLYRPEIIKCFGVYPFQRKIEEYSFSQKEKKEVVIWLNSL